MNKILVTTHPACRGHLTGPGHPECPARMDAINAGMTSHGLWERVDREEAPDALPDQLARAHDSAYVEEILQLDGREKRLDADTVVSPGSVAAALRSAGGVIRGVDAVLSGSHRHAASLGRPPGHHARPANAMGFCLFNNVAVGAAHAMAVHGVERVLIIDIDVHHGNGTQDIFYSSSPVFFFSVHQSPLYPGTGFMDETGDGDGQGFTLNLPFPAGMGDPEYLAMTERLLLPLVDRARPALVMVSAGFDAHEWDPLGGMKISTAGYARMFRLLIRKLEAVGIPGVLVLEGGYSLEALRECAPAMIEAALHPEKEDDATKPAPPRKEAAALIDAVARLPWGA